LSKRIGRSNPAEMAWIGRWQLYPRVLGIRRRRIRACPAVLTAADGAITVKRNVHIMGHGGYVFLKGENVAGTIDVQVVPRSGDWQSINSGSDTGGTTDVKNRDYVTITHHHGTDPTAGGYAYIVLPNVAHSVTFTESDAPTVEVVANNAQAQAIRVAGQGLTLANFFQATPSGGAPTSGVTVSGPCSLAVRTDGGRTTVALSDPSRTQKTARVVLAGVAETTVIEGDDGVRVVGTAPLALEFDLDGHGHAKRIVLGS
jgi:hyaluronate lyase